MQRHLVTQLSLKCYKYLPSTRFEPTTSTTPPSTTQDIDATNCATETSLYNLTGETENQQVRQQHCPPRVLTLKSVSQLQTPTDLHAFHTITIR